DVLAAQLVHPLGHRLLAERRLEEGEDLVAARPRELIGNEILAPEVAAERAPEVRLVRPDGDEAPVARLVDVVARPVAGELLASALRKLAAVPVDGLGAHVPGGGAVGEAGGPP